MGFLTMQTIVAFGFGCLAATVIWYFVIRNNRQNLNAWMAYPEQVWTDVAAELDKLNLDQLDDIAKAKIEAIIKKGKK